MRGSERNYADNHWSAPPWSIAPCPCFITRPWVTVTCTKQAGGHRGGKSPLLVAVLGPDQEAYLVHHPIDAPYAECVIQAQGMKRRASRRRTPFGIQRMNG